MKKKKETIILGIETSCDETAVALVKCTQNKQLFNFDVIENLVHSQIPVHQKTGGVVPEIAAREHAIKLPELLNQLSKKYGQKNLEKTIDAVAITAGPGLITSLLVGVEIAKTIATVWNKPLIPINHLEGHIYANLLSSHTKLPNFKKKKNKLETKNFKFPLVALIVSGGHTELVLMKDHLNYKIVGTTRDDAAGEAFDKTAKLLGLSYPGGPLLAKLATNGNKTAIVFPRPMLNQNNFDFSFSGIKTSVAVYLQKNRRANKADIAASFEEAVVDTLVQKTAKAINIYSPKTVIIAGGVAANLSLREQLENRIKTDFPNITFIKPNLKFATDNAAMIATAGSIHWLKNNAVTTSQVTVNPQMPLC